MTRATGRLEDAYEILQRSERYILCRSKAANPRHTYATMKLDAQGHVYGIRVHSTFEAACRHLRHLIQYFILSLLYNIIKYNYQIFLKFHIFLLY